MAVSEIRADFKCDIKQIWETVASVKNYSWRSDIGKIVVKSEKQFEEHTKDGYVTTFTITVFERDKRYEFDMENENMYGHWTGIFSEQGDTVSIEFIEDVTAKKIFMRPFVKGYLKKQQQQYIADLRKAVEQE